LAVGHDELDVFLLAFDANVFEFGGRQPSIFAARVDEQFRNPKRFRPIGVVLDDTTHVECAHVISSTIQWESRYSIETIFNR
jgi:hypothetical protein